MQPLLRWMRLWPAPSNFNLKGWVSACAALFAFAALVLPAPSWAAGKVALVIGNANYASAPPLENPRNDATDIGAALSDLGFEVFLGIDQTQAEMAALIADFGKAAEGADAAMFYYAGHAFQVSERNYLAPVDIRLDNADQVVAQTVALDDAIAAMEAASGVRLLFIDACRDNPMGLDAGGGSGLARVGTGQDFYIAYATQPGAVAYDGEGRNGTFTEAVLSHLNTPGIGLTDMMMSVRKDVVARTGGQQVPWENSSLTVPFRFSDGPPSASPETMFYQVARRSGDPDLMRLYVERYPAGVHVEEVLALLSSGDLAAQAQRSIGSEAGDDAEQLWALARRTRLPQLFQSYLERYPEGPRAGEAKRMLGELSGQEAAGPARQCELMVTHPRDATETTPGVPFAQLSRHVTAAIDACGSAIELFPEQPTYVALLARAYAAAGLREKAVELYTEAAEKGDLRAMVSLALLKETGDGTAKDPDGALRLYRRAAEAGSADAAINLSVALIDGIGVAKDVEQGLALMQRASEAGSGIATFNLGVLAQDGRWGSPSDALPLFERAAREGETRGYRASAVLLDEGRGVPQNPERAAVQLLLGVASDGGDLMQELIETPQNWTPETMAALQRRLGLAGIEVDAESADSLAKALQAWRNGGFSTAALS